MPAALLSCIKAIGLSIGETVVLGVLLRGGEMQASRVAKEARLNRTTTYGFLQELMEKGLVSKVPGKKVALYTSIDPELLPDYIARKRTDLERREKELRDVLPQIMLMRNKGGMLPEVRVFEGKEDVKQAFQDIVTENKGREVFCITGRQSVQQTFGHDWHKQYLETQLDRGITYQNLMLEDESGAANASEDLTPGHSTKFLPTDMTIDADICMYDSTVGFFSHTNEHYTGLVIQDPTIATAMKKLFLFMQQSAK